MHLSHRAATRLLVLLSAPGALGGCTMVGSQPNTPGPVPVEGAAPTAATDTEAGRITSGVVEIALDAIGTPYLWGGTDANGFDCSGLIQYAYAQFGITLPRVSSAQVLQGSPVDLEPDLLRPGDILGFSLDEPGKTSHVGLYVGSYEFIHSGSDGVSIANILNPYWQEHLVAARRVVP